MKRKPIVKSVATVTAMVLAIAAAATVNAMLGAPGDPTFPPNPWAEKSDAERQADVDAAHKRNDEFLSEFVSNRRDPRTLPRIEIPSYAAPRSTEQEATTDADLIVRGTIESTKFASNPGGGLPIALSLVRVSTTEKGFPRDTIEVRQLGGPVAQETDGAFAHLDNDEPLLPGDEVILLLQQSDDGALITQPGTGIYFVRNGFVEPEKANPFGDRFAGKSADDVVQSIRESLARNAGE